MSRTRQGLLGDKVTGRQEIAGVLYDTNVLGFKGPRRMTGDPAGDCYRILTEHVAVVLPGMSTEGKRTDFSPLSEHDGLIERYKAKNLDGILEVGDSVT